MRWENAFKSAPRGKSTSDKWSGLSLYSLALVFARRWTFTFDIPLFLGGNFAKSFAHGVRRRGGPLLLHVTFLNTWSRGHCNSVFTERTPFKFEYSMRTFFLVQVLHSLQPSVWQRGQELLEILNLIRFFNNALTLKWSLPVKNTIPKLALDWLLVFVRFLLFWESIIVLRIIQKNILFYIHELSPQECFCFVSFKHEHKKVW